MSLSTIGIIMISEDILLDKKGDCHIKFLIKELNGLQYNVFKVTIIPEKENIIAKELDLMVKHCDVVIVVCERNNVLSGALAKLTCQIQKPNDTLSRILNEIKEPQDTEHIILPCYAKILSHNNIYPIIHFQRIFILREKYLKQCFSKILKFYLLQYRKERSFRKIITITLNDNVNFDQNDLMDNNILAKFKKEDRHVVIDASSTMLSSMVEFETNIKDKFGDCRIQSVDQSDVWADVYSRNEEHIRNALQIIEKCVEQYGLENIFVSFNGGKDCTVLLHLVLSVLKKKYPQHKKPLFCVYVQSDRTFPEQDDFIAQIRCFYDLEISTVQSGIKDALQQTLLKHPNYTACLMGTRRTDPFSSDLNIFQLTDANWPQIMRVSPLLDWHYSDIWDYLLFFKVPYCKLYDMGFTSLGNTENTTKNPSLIYYDQFDEKEICLPAYKLLKEENERNGRH